MHFSASSNCEVLSNQHKSYPSDLDWISFFEYRSINSSGATLNCLFIGIPPGTTSGGGFFYSTSMHQSLNKSGH
jgi:hypothetical protein